MITFGFLTPTTGVIVLIIALVIFGPGKLPEIGRSLGNGIKEFRNATDGKSKETPSVKDSSNGSVDNENI